MIITGAKVIEYRSWPTNHRGQLFVHVGLSFDADAPDWTGPPLVYGAVLGYVTLHDVTRGAGRLVLASAGSVSFPRPMRASGRLGLWRWSQ